MKKILSVLLVLAMILSMAACGGKTTEEPAATTPSGTTSSSTPAASTGTSSTPAAAESTEPAVFTMMYEVENTTLNYLASGKALEHKVAAQIVDGLVEFTNHSEVVPAMAESWECSDDGLVWTFHIRQGQYWYDCNGTQIAEVTAQDWVDGLKAVADPYNDSGTYDQIKIVAGVEDFYNGMVEGTNPDFNETVGVKAIDKYTLEYTLNRVTPYFIPGLAYVCWLPVYGPLVEETMTTDETTGLPAYGFGTSIDKIYSCGSFILTEWEPQVKQTFVKNENNWDADRVYIDRIEKTYNAEAPTLAPAMALRDEVGFTEISTDVVDDWKANHMDILSKSREDNAWHYFYLFDFKPTYDDEYRPEDWMKAALNENFRHSLCSAFDREYVVRTAVDPEGYANLLQRSITPAGTSFSSDGKDFNQNKAFNKIEDNFFDLAKAADYKAKAMEELSAQGVTFPINVVVSYQSGSTEMENQAVVVKQMLEENLGTDYIECVLWAGPSENFLSQTRSAGKYSFMRCNWGADYIDPQTWTDPFSGGRDPETGYKVGCTYNRMDLMTDDEAFRYAFNNIDTNSMSKYTEEIIASDGYKEMQAILNEYYDLVDKGINEGIDMDTRYDYFAQAEALLINHAVILPCYIKPATYQVTKLNVFEGAWSACGYCSYQYKGMHLLDHYVSMDEFLANQESFNNGDF